MKKLLIGVSLVFLSVFASAQGLEDIIVERYYISDANDASAVDGGPLTIGSVTYRIFVDMAPGYILQAVYASQNNIHELRIETTTMFFNNIDRGATTPNAIANNRLPDNTVMLDSWVSLGGAAAGKIGIPKQDDTDGAIVNADGFLQNDNPLAGVPIKTKDGMIPGTPAQITMAGLDQAISVFDAENAGPLFSTMNGTWYTAPGVSGPTADNKVLVAQITTNGVLTFKLNLQLRRESDLLVEKWVHSNPVSNEILCEKCTFNGVITDVNDVHTRGTGAEFMVFPNPVKDVLNLKLISEIQDGTYSYSIMNIIGKKMLQGESNVSSGNYIRNVDISFLPHGAYILRLTSEDGFSSAKLFIKNQ